jgi:hypothetical protein
MTSFTKTGCALIDSDDGNCLLAEASITPGGLYVISKAGRRASLAARSLSATAASSSSKSLAPLSKDMQLLWHARLGHVGFETVTCAAKTRRHHRNRLDGTHEELQLSHLSATKGIAPTV